jgi:hypothetical protein
LLVTIFQLGTFVTNQNGEIVLYRAASDTATLTLIAQKFDLEERYIIDRSSGSLVELTILHSSLIHPCNSDAAASIIANRMTIGQALIELAGAVEHQLTKFNPSSEHFKVWQRQLRRTLRKAQKISLKLPSPCSSLPRENVSLTRTIHLLKRTSRNIYHIGIRAIRSKLPGGRILYRQARSDLRAPLRKTHNELNLKSVAEWDKMDPAS